MNWPYCGALIMKMMNSKKKGAAQKRHGSGCSSLSVNRPVNNALLSKCSRVKVYYTSPYPFFRKIVNLYPQIPVYGALGPLRVLYSSNIFVGPSFGPTGPTFLTRCCKCTYFLTNRVRKILN